MKALLLGFFILIGAAGRAEPVVLRVGHFPNVTHAQGVIAHALTGKGRGWFEARLGPDVKIQWFVYNAGPSAMEAIFANSIDLTYVGPSPALNAYSKAHGDEIRIIAGAVNGGAALVVQPDGRIKVPADFRGKKVATPQLGNTQDVECRAWLTQQGFKITQLGGDVLVLPTANPDQLNLFKENQIDAVWTVEPWVSRLEREAGAKIFLEQRDTVTTVLVSSVKCLRDRRELVKKFAQAHAELTEWIQNNPAEAQTLLRDELADETTRPIPAELIAQTWQRMQFTTTVATPVFNQFVKSAQAAGFMRGAPDLGRLIELP
ncbi:MAG: ABC transporter substrate-binding protein [Verrucomicrobiota bacterium]